MLNLISFISQIITFIICLLFLKNKKEDFFKLFALLSGLVFVTETTGMIMLKKGINTSTLYYFFSIFNYTIIYLMYNSIIKKQKWMLAPKTFLFIFYIVISLTFFYPNLFTYSQIIASLGLGFLIFIYLKDLLMSDEILNYKNQIPFWVSLGLLTFYIPSIPFFSMMSFMKSRGLFGIIYFLILLENLIISMGIIWSHKKE